VERYLVEELSTELVVVGQDFRFGKDGAGNPELLGELGKEFGFTVQLADEVCEADGSRISSSAVREAILSGDVEAAAQMLGRQHSVSGVVVHGLKRGKELGFPTANLSEDTEGLIPPAGVYAGSIELEGKTYIAAISIGDNPTFNDVTRNQVEAYALDAEFDAYGKIATIFFGKRIRGNEAFPDVETLIAQIATDVEQARAISKS
jgi:riboflavin kinase/FMN adenylyltransferase